MRWFNPNEKREINPIPMQTLEQVQDEWPADEIGVRNGDFMVRPHQKWTITAVEGVGGFLGQPYYKITIAGTERTLTATKDGNVTTTAKFDKTDEQLWQIDQMTDGTYRIMPKSEAKGAKRCLVSIADSTPTLAEFDFNNDNCKWNLKELR